MTLFATPTLEAVDREVLSLIDELRAPMSTRVGRPSRWLGMLRRVTLARAVQGSNSVEGYNASLDDVAAALDGEPTMNADEATAAAVAGYRDAMTYVLQVAQDEHVVFDEGLVKAMHFMMIKHEPEKWPGRWRPGEIFVRDEARDETVYEGPDADEVPLLVGELTEHLRNDRSAVMVRAAMAHLNFVMIHPFRDGNGRMARALQTLVLAKEQIVAPVFSCIEEYIGRNTEEYYAVLAEVGAGRWSPERDALPWVRYCLTAHYRQASTHLRRIEEIEALYRGCAAIARASALPDRAVGPLVEAAYGFRLRNATYRHLVEQTSGESISELTASRELRALVDADVLEPHGRNRSRHYTGQTKLRDLWQDVRGGRPPREQSDPYAVAAAKLQLSLDL